MKGKTVLFIGLVWPEPTSSAAGWRILQLIDFFTESESKVHFASAASKSDFSFEFDSNEVTEHKILLNDSSFDVFIEELNPDIVVYDRFMIEEQFGWRVRENCPKAVQILDTEDLHFVRKAREKAYKKQEELNYYTNEMIREIASIFRCDLSLIISESEMELLQTNFNIPSKNLMYLPFMENEVSISEFDTLPDFDTRNHFMFIGNFMHEPNWQTVLNLKNKIWPVLRKQLPNAELHVFGAYPTSKAFQLHKPTEKFFIDGKAKNVNIEMQKYKVLLAPIPFGAGIKGKFIDAMKNKLPSVTSTFGSESMSENQFWNGFISDNNDDFIEKSISLYNDKTVWNDSVLNGFEILKTTTNKKEYSLLFHQRLSTLFENLEDVRRTNIFGEILKFQNNQATKYMSLWIQEKNKH